MSIALERRGSEWVVVQEPEEQKVATLQEPAAVATSIQDLANEALPAVGGGALAVVASEVLGGLTAGLGGGNISQALVKVVGAWGVGALLGRQFPTATRYAQAFLLYDAVRTVVPIDQQVRNLLQGFLRRGGGGGGGNAGAGAARTTVFSNEPPW